jgi:hypothetical protein
LSRSAGRRIIGGEACRSSEPLALYSTVPSYCTVPVPCKIWGDFGLRSKPPSDGSGQVRSGQEAGPPIARATGHFLYLSGEAPSPCLPDRGIKRSSPLYNHIKLPSRNNKGTTQRMCQGYHVQRSRGPWPCLHTRHAAEYSHAS